MRFGLISSPSDNTVRWVSGTPMGGHQFLYAMLGYVPLHVGKSTGTYIIITKTPTRVTPLWSTVKLGHLCLELRCLTEATQNVYSVS